VARFSLRLSKGSHAGVHWIADQVRNDMQRVNAGDDRRAATAA
jgi:hypothetical protein